jgi:hypothetical protein
MRGAGMRQHFAGMAVGMDVHRAVAMAVLVKMHAVAPQPPQHMGAETNQHDADGGLDRPRECFGDSAAEQDGGAGKEAIWPAPRSGADDITNGCGAGDAGSTVVASSACCMLTKN